MARITPTNEAWKDCPRADECNVNNCPLTNKQYQSFSCDAESKCTFGKTGRKRIGEKWGLKNGGLTGKEIAGKKKWDNLPEEVKKARIDKLKKKSPIVRLSEKGYTISRKKKDMPSLHVQNGQMGVKIASDNDSVEVNNE